MSVRRKKFTEFDTPERVEEIIGLHYLWTDFQVLFKFTSLTILNLDWTNTTDRDCKEISRIGGSLTNLYLNHCISITDRGVSYLKALKNLEIFGCNNSVHVTWKSLIKLTPNLKSLDLSFGNTFDNRSMKKITKSLTNLQQLNIFGCERITYEGIYPVSKLPNLLRLSYNFNDPWVTKQYVKCLIKSNSLLRIEIVTKKWSVLYIDDGDDINMKKMNSYCHIWNSSCEKFNQRYKEILLKTLLKFPIVLIDLICSLLPKRKKIKII